VWLYCTKTWDVWTIHMLMHTCSHTQHLLAMWSKPRYVHYCWVDTCTCTYTQHVHVSFHVLCIYTSQYTQHVHVAKTIRTVYSTCIYVHHHVCVQHIQGFQWRSLLYYMYVYYNMHIYMYSTPTTTSTCKHVHVYVHAYIYLTRGLVLQFVTIHNVGGSQSDTL